MADSKCAPTSNVLDLTKCYLCSKSFSDPKLLPCLHFFCAGCLSKRYTSQTGLGDSNAVCPICLAAFTVPRGGLGCLATNNLVKRTVELQKVTSQDGAVCGACLENEGNAPATVYCRECEQYLCAACSSIHKRLKTTSSHTVLTIGVDRAFSMEDLVKNDVEMCPQHPQERTTLYCSHCWKLICTVCFAAEHNTHTCKDVLSEAEGFRSRLTDEVELLSSRGEWYKSEMKELKLETRKFLASISEAQKGIRDKAQEAKRAIDEQQNELLTRLDQLKEEKVAEIRGSERCFGTSMSSVEHCLQFVLDVLSKGSDGDVLGLYSDMYRRLKWLLKDTPMTVTLDSVTFQTQPAVVGKKAFHFGGIQQQLVFSPQSHHQPAYGFAAKGRMPAKTTRCLLQNPLGAVVITSTASNRHP